MNNDKENDPDIRGQISLARLAVYQKAAKASGATVTVLKKEGEEFFNDSNVLIVVSKGRVYVQVSTSNIPLFWTKIRKFEGSVKY